MVPGKHIFELIDGVSFVIVGASAKVETILRVSLLKRRTKTHKDTDNFFVTVWRTG
jgi:hypothetical protein